MFLFINAAGRNISHIYRLDNQITTVSVAIDYLSSDSGEHPLLPASNPRRCSKVVNYSPTLLHDILVAHLWYTNQDPPHTF